jgi:hypothetical protein
VFFLDSCQEEKEPTLSFSFGNLSSGQTVWNITPVDFITQSSFNGTIEVKVDGQAIGNLSQSPYQFNWNTRTLTDGIYTLVAVATSANGETQEIKQDVIVRNTLLIFDVAVDQIPFGLRAFIFLSDASGNIIAQSEFKNGDHVELPGSENFNDASFMVNEAYVAYPNYLQVYSVGEMTRGPWTLNTLDESPSFVGSIELKSDVTNSFFYVSASGDSKIIRENSGNILLATTKSPSQLFLRQLNTPDNKYALLKNVNVGTSLSFPVDTITTPLQSIGVSLSDSKFVSARVKLFGFPEAENYSEYYPLGDFLYNTKEFKIEYPEKEFAAIGSESSYRNKQIRLYSFHPNKTHDFQTLKAEIDVSSSDGKWVDLATFGDFDIYAASWFYFDEFTRGYGSWMMIGPPNRSQRLRLPDLPDEVIKLVPSVKTKELSFTGAIQVSEFAQLNGYSAYCKFVSKNGIAGPYKFGNPWKEQLFAGSGFTSGRISAMEVPMLVEKLKIVE